jgi:hypothetical protein
VQRGRSDFSSTFFFSCVRAVWTSDGGKALSKELVGTWRNTEASGMGQYRFLPNGRYEYGQGTSTTFGNLETKDRERRRRKLFDPRL